MRVLIVEDSDLIHASLLEVLADCAGVEVVGRAVGEDEAVELIGRMAPDVVLLDLVLTPGSGLSVLRRVRDGGSTARIYVLSNEVARPVRVRCIEEGADGFFDKCNELGALIECLSEGTSETTPGPALPPPARDEDPRGALDAIVAQAAALTGCPMAAVTLVGTNRQWLLAREGLEFARTSRHVAFCAHTVAGRGLLEVPDASQDSRFAENPLTGETFGVRYYAGMPLVLSSGCAVGALCVLDTRSHSLDASQREALARLAEKAAAHVEQLQLDAIGERAERARRCGTRDEPGLDVLTQLPDRATLASELHRWLDLRVPGQPRGAVLAVGLDRLGWINLTFGRAAGDMLLREIARRIEGCMAGRGCVARIGGDEFGVMVPDIADEAEALIVGEAIAQAIAAPLLAGGTVLRVRSSVGMALGTDGVDAAHLAAHAELAMKHAKKLGGNLCQLYTDWMGSQASERVMREHELRRAIAARQFVLDFQPQIELGGSGITGVEALARWEHPVRGRLYPDSFIGLAEETGLIRELGAQVLELAVEQFAIWRDAGLPVPLMAVNVSPQQLGPDFLDLVRDTLSRHRVEPRWLELELTESTLPQNDAVARETLQALRAMGVSIAVDDFGIGYSSLAALHRLPVTTLKIDRSFIADVDSTQAAAIVQAVVTLARALGLRTVAEGVEVAAQADCVSMLGCDRAQGYLFGRPVSPAAIAELLSQHAAAASSAAPSAVDTHRAGAPGAA